MAGCALSYRVVADVVLPLHDRLKVLDVSDLRSGGRGDEVLAVFGRREFPMLHTLKIGWSSLYNENGYGRRTGEHQSWLSEYEGCCRWLAADS